jgi:hypothetical protein
MEAMALALVAQANLIATAGASLLGVGLVAALGWREIVKDKDSSNA